MTTTEQTTLKNLTTTNSADGVIVAAVREFVRVRIKKDGPIVRSDLGECWLWLGSRAGGAGRVSYGIMQICGRTMAAHRVVYELEKERLQPGTVVMHKCDNQECVNPDHLVAGTQKENVLDMMVKGRRVSPNLPRGESHWMKKYPERIKRGASHALSKLDPDSVRQIRLLYGQGATQRVLGEKFGVSQKVIANVLRGISYGEVE